MVGCDLLAPGTPDPTILFTSCAQMAPRWLKIAPRSYLHGVRAKEDGPKEFQDSPKMAQDGPRYAQTPTWMDFWPDTSGLR